MTTCLQKSPFVLKVPKSSLAWKGARQREKALLPQIWDFCIFRINNILTEKTNSLGMTVFLSWYGASDFDLLFVEDVLV